MCTIRRPTRGKVNEDSRETEVAVSPESSEKGASRRILERFSNLSLELPIHCTPDFDTAIVGLRCQKLPNWVPANTLDETMVLIDSADSFLEREDGHIMMKRRLIYNAKGRT